MPQTTKINTATGHKCTTHSEGSMAAAPPPTEPQNALKRLTALPHAVAVTRICARKDGGVYSTASDGRVCLTNDTGRPSLKFGQRGSIEVDGWQHDLDLVEDQLLLGAGALATKAWDATTGAQVASLQGHQGATRCVSGFVTSRIATGGDDGFCRVSDLSREDAPCVAKLEPTQSEDYGVKSVLSDSSNVVTLVDAAGRLQLWDRRGGTPVALGEHPEIANKGIARDGTSIYSLGGRRAQVLAWDARKPGQSRIVGKHQDAPVALAMCSKGVLSASKDGGVALWDATSCSLLDELRAPGKKPTALSVVDDVVYACYSDRVVRAWEAGTVPRPPGPRPCCDCEGSGRKTLPSGSKCICVACFGSGKSPVDDVSSDEDDDVSTQAPPPPEVTKTVETKKAPAKVPSWLTKLTAVGALKAPAKPGQRGGLDVRSTRFKPGTLVVLAASLPDAEPVDTLKRKGGAEPSIRGNEVGEIKADDRSRVPYEVKGPRATTSWFEAAQLAACPPERAAKGKAALAAAKAPAPPKPPKAVPVRAPTSPSGADAAFMNFRGIAAAPVPGGTAVAPRAQPKTKEEKAAQRAADANVDASLQQYMAQREAKKAAAGGGRKPVSDRLKKLRERAG